MLHNLITYTPIRQIRRIYIERAINLQNKPSQSFISQCKNKTSYAYIPWIKNLGDRLIEQISQSDQYKIIPLSIFDNPDDRDQRRLIIEYSRCYPEEYKQIIRAWLSPIAKSLKGCLFTFDWLPIMRHAVVVCNELGITTILIPHESVFFEEEKYYMDIRTGHNLPLTDWILGWGNIQKEIFSKRGYPKEKFLITGAPKFDAYHNYKPRHTRDEFFNLAGLSPIKRTILFAAQTMDSQLETEDARKSQRKAIWDVYKYCMNNDIQFILRFPPSQYQVLSKNQLKQIINSNGCFIDKPDNGYLFTPEETIYYCNLTTSVNSTMLFEALIMKKPTLSVKYTSFQHTWQKAGIKIVENKEMLLTEIRELFKENNIMMTEWAKDAFSPGEFDGKSTQRIISFLENL